MTMLRYIECGKVPISTLAAPPPVLGDARKKGYFFGIPSYKTHHHHPVFLLLIRYVQVRQEESFEEEATFARPPPPRRRPDSFQVVFLTMQP